MRNQNVTRLVITAMLCAIGIVIPMFSPVRVVMEPASFTLGSHIVIFIAMFISPSVAVAVALGTTAGFFLGGFPIVVVLRAATHVIFAYTGARVLLNRHNLLSSVTRTGAFAVLISLLHAVCEVIVVTFFYFGNGMSSAYYAKGYVFAVILLVGVGTIVHSMVDFGISILIWKVLSKTKKEVLSTVMK